MDVYHKSLFCTSQPFYVCLHFKFSEDFCMMFVCHISFHCTHPTLPSCCECVVENRCVVGGEGRLLSPPPPSYVMSFVAFMIFSMTGLYENSLDKCRCLNLKLFQSKNDLYVAGLNFGLILWVCLKLGLYVNVNVDRKNKFT